MLRIPFWVCIDVCKRVLRHEENAHGKSLTVYLCNRAYNGKQGVGVFLILCVWRHLQMRNVVVINAGMYYNETLGTT